MLELSLFLDCLYSGANASVSGARVFEGSILKFKPVSSHLYYISAHPINSDLLMREWNFALKYKKRISQEFFLPQVFSYLIPYRFFQRSSQPTVAVNSDSPSLYSFWKSTAFSCRIRPVMGICPYYPVAVWTRRTKLLSLFHVHISSSFFCPSVLCLRFNECTTLNRFSSSSHQL